MPYLFITTLSWGHFQLKFMPRSPTWMCQGWILQPVIWHMEPATAHRARGLSSDHADPLYVPYSELEARLCCQRSAGSLRTGTGYGERKCFALRQRALRSFRTCRREGYRRARLGQRWQGQAHPQVPFSESSDSRRRGICASHNSRSCP
jgi:hypothetical protein